MELKINKKSYLFTSKNYYSIHTIKNKIVIGHTFTNDVKFINGYKLRYNEETKKTWMFTIDKKGKIYQHFDTNYYSYFTGNLDIDKTIISILLVNEGWLTYNAKEKKYFNCYGCVVKNKPIEKKWRNKLLWTPYTDEQHDALILLTKFLLEENVITPNISESNVFKEIKEEDYGVFYRSNFNKVVTDLSPAFNYNYFKDAII